MQKSSFVYCSIPKPIHKGNLIIVQSAHREHDRLEWYTLGISSDLDSPSIKLSTEASMTRQIILVVILTTE